MLSYFRKLLLIVVVLSFQACAEVTTIKLPAEREQQLMHLLVADCGSCHGMTLKGGLGPSLLAKDISIKTDQQLFFVIKFGSTVSPMPPWENFLNDNEINWMINTLRQQSWLQQGKEQKDKFE